MTCGRKTAWTSVVAYQRVFSTLGCAEFSLVQALDLAARHRLHGVELRALAGSLDLPAVLEAEYGTPQRLAQRLAGGGARIVAFDSSWHLVGGGEKERADFLQLVPWAEALGSQWIRVFDGGQTGDRVEIDAAAATLDWWRNQRARHGWQVDVMIETHDSLFTAEKIGRLVAAVPDVAILWDSHHTWKRGGEDPVRTWDAIAARVVHVHVKDSVGRPSAKHPYSYVLPGTGEFPAASLLTRVRDEFAGPVSLEWERLWHPYLPSLEDALVVAARSGWW